MSESRVITALKSIGATRRVGKATAESWKPVLKELADVVEVLEAESAESIAVLDKVFWLVLATDGVTLFTG